MRLRRLATSGGLVAILALVAQQAGSQEALVVRIREAALDETGFVRLVVSATGAAVGRNLDASSFSVSEEGQRVREFEVEPLFQSRVQPVAIVLAIDVSGSTKGKPLTDAQSAARTFVQTVPEGTQIALVAFGPTAALRADFTPQREAIVQAIDALQAGGETALYDGVALALSALGRIEGQRNMLVFSDGKDTVSKTSLDAVIAGAKDSNTSVTSIVLVTPDSDQAPLERLAGETGGRTLSVASSGDLASAFAQVAQEVASQYVLTYKATRAEPKELDISVTVQVDSIKGSDSIVALNPRLPQRPSVQPAPPAPVGLLASGIGLAVGILGAFLATALLFGVIVYRPTGGSATKALRLGLRTYGPAAAQQQAPTTTSGIARKAVELVEQLPKPKGFEERLQFLIDRSGWPLRASEFLALQGFGAFVGLIVGWGLFGKLIIGVALALIGWRGPRFVLKMKGERRTAQFVSQLPDTLQLLAASLQAGYGFVQALDTVVQESGPPTSVEFARVLTEARLGMAVEEALEGMADRIDSEDFRWVVLAVTIQRQVGGNLAQVLNTVATTIREREQLRRQIKTLSAEGRISAIILTALPIFLAVYLTLFNPDYIRVLFQRAIGIVMIIGALIFMGLGILWMRKIIRIDT